MKLFIALIASLFFVSACSTEQNPLAGVSDKVNEGKPPGPNKPIEEEPLSKSNLQIDAPPQVNAEVDSEVKFKITGRVLAPGMQFVLELDNLEAFPGATFDAATGDFTWTPTKSSIGTQISALLYLNVTISNVVAPGHISTSEVKAIPIVLMNKFVKPTIKSVSGYSEVIGGSAYRFAFALKNRDAANKDDISIVGQSCGANVRTLTSYMSLVPSSVKDIGNGEYTGEVTLDLWNAENLTAGQYCIALAATTSQGKISDIYKLTVNYLPKVLSAYSTLSKDVEMVVGDYQKYTFSIYDPSGTGEMTVLNVDDISKDLPGTTINCAVDSYNKSMVYCEALLDARTAVPGKVRAKIEVRTTRSKQTVKSSHILTVNVKAATP